MSASISHRKSNVSLEFLKKTAGYITGATGEYISDVMPVSSSTISGAREAYAELHSTIGTQANNILPKMRELNMQNGFRSLSNWFLQKESDFDDNIGDIDSQLKFDVSDGAEIAQATISESSRNANQISKIVAESSHKLVEAQIASTANIVISLDKQTAVISSGFDKTHRILEKLLEVTTKNTSTLIETQIAAANSSFDRKPGSRQQFDFGDYKKMVAGNIKNSEMGFVMSMIPLAMQWGKNIKPQEIIQMGIEAGMNKFAPSFQKNAKALDQAVSDVITGSLIRLGEHKMDGGPLGMIAEIFGINTDRRRSSPTRSSIELKSIPFDTVTKNAITEAIPGYLRKILVALGGSDEIFDYRSNKFTTKRALQKELSKMSANTDTLYNAGSGVRKSIGTEGINPMLYDLMMNELTDMKGSKARKTIDSWQDPKNAESFMKKVISGVKLSPGEQKQLELFIQRLPKVVGSTGNGSNELFNQRGRLVLQTDARMNEYLKDADNYSVDLRGMKDTRRRDKQAIVAEHDHEMRGSQINTSSQMKLTGTNYSNMALYEIFRLLNRGINVYQIGAASGKNARKKPFEELSLDRPLGYRGKEMRKETPTVGVASLSDENRSRDSSNIDDGPNELTVDVNEDGTPRTKGERFMSWGKKRGGPLAKALFSGSQDDVKDAFSNIVKDVGEIAGSGIKKGLSNVNDTFGNVTGFIKHKFTGQGYSYQNGTDAEGKPITKTISDNKAGGIFGFVKEEMSGFFKGAKEKGTNWFKDVAGYFDFKGTPGSEGDKSDTPAKRKKFLLTSVGAYAGAGILGGPVGLLAGAIAGNALSVTGVGSRIHEFLFGKDYTDKKGREKHKLGVVERVVNGIVDPIKYQVGKSFKTLGHVLKKNILGPLSDVGVAIKDRISQAATTHFSPVFKLIGGLITAPFKAVTSIAKAPITLLGNIFRGTVSAGGAVAEGSLEGLASIIAGKTRKDEDGNIIGGRGFIKQRRKERNATIKADRENEENEYAGGYKAWKERQDEKRKSTWGRFKKSTEETVADATAGFTGETAQNTQRMAEASEQQIKILNEERIPGSSFKTHDEGMHKMMKAWLEHLGASITPGAIKGPIKFKKKKEDGSNIAGSAISTVASIVGSNDSIDNTEAGFTDAILDESTKDSPDKGKIRSTLKNLFSHKKKKGEEGEKEKPWWEKLLGGISNIFGGFDWKTALLAIGTGLALFNDNIRGLLGKGATNLLDYVVNGGDKNNAALNAVTSPLDIRANSEMDYVNPLASLYHVNQDAAGNDIVNQNATRAKNSPWRHMGQQLVRRGAGAIGYNAQQSYFTNQARTAKSAGDMNAYRQNMSQAADARRGMKTRVEDPLGSSGRGALSRTARFGGALGVGMVGGQLAGYGVTKGLSALGVDEQYAEFGGRIAEVGSQISLTKGALTGKGLGGKAMDFLDEFLKKLGDVFTKIAPKIAQKFPAAKGVATLFSNVKSKLTKTVLKPFLGKITALLTKMGIGATAGVATAGIATAVMIGAGAVIGGCNAENLFSVLPGQADALMRSIAAGLGAIFDGVPFVGLIEIADIIVAPLNEGKGVRQMLAEFIYRGVGNDEALQEKQGNMKSQLSLYNEMTGSNLNVSTFNDDVNRGFWKRTWEGSQKYDKDGNIVIDQNTGELVKSGGIKGIGRGIASGAKFVGSKLQKAGSWAKDKVTGFTGAAANMLQGAGTMAKEFWSGEYERDEDGNPILDSDGKPVRKGGFGDMAAKSLGKIGSAIAQPLKDAYDGANSWINEKADWIKDKASSAGAWISEKAGATWKTISDPIKDFADGAKSWLSEKADWVTDKVSAVGDKLSPAKDWVKAKVSDLYGNITGGIKDMSEGAKSWLTEKADWVKDGVKDAGAWISEKAKGIWDWVTKPFNEMSEKGEQAKKDNAFIASQQAARGNTGGGMKGGFGGYVEESPSNANSSSTPSGQEGGNPLNKTFSIGRYGKYGYGPDNAFRTWSNGFHEGVDLTPTDGSRQAEIGAKYSGTVTDVVSKYPDSHTGLNTMTGPYGNYVEYTTPEGIKIKNAHLKAGSIPSNIQKGSQVTSGMKIGEMGSTGNSSGPHLHYQMKDKSGNWIDPTPDVSGGKMSSSFTNTSGSTHQPGGSSSISGSSGSALSSVVSGAGSVFGKILGIIKGLGSKVLSWLSGSDSGESGDASGSASFSDNQSAVLAEPDPEADKILFQKLKSLDTSYTDWPGHRKNWSNEKLKEFILKIAPAIQATLDCGVLASIRIAQAILESDWGRSDLAKSNNNLFGVKTGDGTGWMKYDSWEHCIQKHAYGTYHNGYYDNALRIGDYKVQIRAIAPTYCPETPSYVPSIENLIQSNSLTYFDHPKEKGSGTKPNDATPGQSGNELLATNSGATSTYGPPAPNQKPNTGGGYGGYGERKLHPRAAANNSKLSSRRSFGVGGGVLENHSSVPKYTPKNIPLNNRSNSSYRYGASKGVFTSEDNGERSYSIGTNNLPLPSSSPSSFDTSDSEVKALLRDVLTTLNSIANNTGDANSYLDSINGKDFGVDKDMRNAVKQLGKVRSKTPTSKYNHDQNRNVNSLLTP